MKRPLFRLQYDLPDVAIYTEQGSDRGAKFEATIEHDADLIRCLQQMKSMNLQQITSWYNSHMSQLEGVMHLLPLDCDTPEAVAAQVQQRPVKLMVMARPLHTILHLDETLDAFGNTMTMGHYVVFHCMTARLYRNLTMQHYPWGVAQVVAFAQFLWHRVCPKLRLTRGLYFSLTHGKQRIMSRVEVLGRIARSGFEVMGEHFHDGEFYVVARKGGLPTHDNPPTGSPIIHLQRVGYGGNDIVVHKFRTMYTYSEYLQPYIYRYQHLGIGGKFHDDYRITFYGRWLRRLYLDEIPMLWNLVKGDVKLVGVRPLSRQYFNLYSPDIQQLRTQVKPGLLPPFYYDRVAPSTLDEVMDSERRYLEAYLQHPLRTDWRYFWGIVGNLLLRHRRSK